jgi:endo-1,4-beta-mannosidase
MEEKDSFAVIKEDLPRAVSIRRFLHWLRKIGIIREPMVVIREERHLITETGTIVVFDINGKEIALVERKDGVLKITPKIKNVSNLICNFKDFDEENNIIKTTEDVMLQSKRNQSQTTISQSAIAKASCHPC